METVRDRDTSDSESLVERSKEMVGEHVVPSTLIAFGAGVGAGILLITLLAPSRPTRHASITKRLGQQVLDAMSAVVPDSLKSS